MDALQLQGLVGQFYFHHRNALHHIVVLVHFFLQLFNAVVHQPAGCQNAAQAANGGSCQGNDRHNDICHNSPPLQSAEISISLLLFCVQTAIIFNR